MTTADGSLVGKMALVTGGSHGIGEAICLALAGAGADVLLTFRTDRAAADEVARRSQQHGVHAAVVQADLDTLAGAGDLVARARNQARQPDIVVSNATASFAPSRLADLDAATLGRKAGADLAVLHTLATAFMPPMRQRGFGRLLVIPSAHALGPGSPGMCAHGTAKAALEAYVAYAADELGGDGVTVNALRLGFVATRSTAAVPPPARDLLAAATPAGRLAAPADIAAAASLLAQPAAGWINGTIIPVTGGLNQPLNMARLLTPARPAAPSSRPAHALTSNMSRPDATPTAPPQPHDITTDPAPWERHTDRIWRLRQSPNGNRCCQCQRRKPGRLEPPQRTPSRHHEHHPRVSACPIRLFRIQRE